MKFMQKIRGKTVFLFGCITALLFCFVLMGFMDSGNIRANAAEIVYQPGDINGDGEVNGKDITRLMKFIAGVDVEVVESLIDTNTDGDINNEDIINLMRYVAGEIPELSENAYHRINYYDTVTGYSNTNYYSESLGLENNDFPELSCVGRTFLGWSTKENDEDAECIIKTIPKGSTENYNLYACWEFTKYNISYRYQIEDVENTVINLNDETYTMVDEFEFKSPVLSGLKFSHWSVGKAPETGEILIYNDSTGESRMKLQKGTTGDIELIAHWKSYENLVIPKTENRNVATEYDSENGLFYFIYELGTIENVVLDSNKDDFVIAKTDYFTTYTRSVTETMALGTERAEGISNTIAESITNHSEWSETNENVQTLTSSIGAEITTGFEAGVEGIFKEKIEMNFKYDFGTEESWSHAETVGGSVDSGTETSEEVSSTISYKKEFTTTDELTRVIDQKAPLGNYYFVHAGNVKVYAFMVYDPAEKAFYLDTYSILDNAHSILLYEPSGYNDFETDSLSYNIAVDEIEEKIKSAYYVKYDPNGGEGKMNLSVFNNSGENQFSENKFTKVGYSHIGWKNTDVNGGKIYEPEDKVTDKLAEAGCTVTMYAQWVANSYEVTLDSNGGTVPTEKVSVTYDSEYGELPTPVRQGYTFTGWKLDTNLINKSSIVKTASDHTLVASWKANTYNIIYNLCEDMIHDEPLCSEETDTIIYDSEDVELVVPTCDIYKFDGWYTEADGGEKVSDVEGKVTKWTLADTDENGNINLYARWSTEYTLIKDLEGLKSIKNDMAGKYALIDDIDMPEENWVKFFGDFTGIFDGNGHKIIGLTCTELNVNDGGTNYGLFEKLSGATVRDVTFVDVSIKLGNQGQTPDSSYNVGILAGIASYSTISNVSVYGSVRFEGTYGGGAHVGGVIGKVIAGKISDCSNYAHIYAAKGTAKAGGIVGITSIDMDYIFDLENLQACEFINCYNNGTVEARLMVYRGNAYAAGIVGDDCGNSVFDTACCNGGTVVTKDNGSSGGTYKENDIKN